ncbi:hypothetical protein KC19_5G200700 [Ceratodon purpureus]|uniref:Uncharacterized protein n=1 Tax=Ceratodon purpureus TaxID=3225 RepID=A0A8T0I3I9_CERPU|nr:hypothetical protein KC19_5G200700 [Ceratodon purpureus]
MDDGRRWVSRVLISYFDISAVDAEVTPSRTRAHVRVTAQLTWNSADQRQRNSNVQG